MLYIYLQIHNYLLQVDSNILLYVAAQLDIF